MLRCIYAVLLLQSCYFMLLQTVLQLMTLFITSVLTEEKFNFSVKIHVNNVLYAFLMLTNVLSNMLDECKLT